MQPKGPSLARAGPHGAGARGSCKLLRENVSGLRMLCRGNILNIKRGTFVPQNRRQKRGIRRTPFLGQAAVTLRWSHVHFLSELTVQKAGSPPWHYSSPAQAGRVGTGLPTSEPLGLSIPLWVSHASFPGDSFPAKPPWVRTQGACPPFQQHRRRESRRTKATQIHLVKGLEVTQGKSPS